MMQPGQAQRKTWDGGRSGHPAPAFDEAARGSRGWGIRPADVVVAAATLLGALGVCCVLWFGFGVQGVPGVSAGQGSDAEISADAPEEAWGTASQDTDGGHAISTAGANGDAGDGDGAKSVSQGVSPEQLSLDAGGLSTSSGLTPDDLGVDAGFAPAAPGNNGTVTALYAVAQNSDGFYQVLPLNEDTTVTVVSSLGTNVIEVAEGRVRCLESDCSNQTCVNQGWVSGRGQTIVCLPHKLVVQVVADPKDATPLS